MDNLIPYLVAALAAVAAGAVNAIAGGGTLLTFPALIAVGIPPIIANATSSVALWPGTMSSMWGYRRALVGAESWAIRFAIPSLAGGIVGALLLLRTPPDRFAAMVPFLVLGATLLFMAQAPTMRAVKLLRDRQARGHPDPPLPLAAVRAAGSASPRLAPPTIWILLFQFVVSIYGGYFGAGMGILMLAALGFMGLTHIHQMNGLKNWGGTCINLVAVAIFAWSGIVNWPFAIVMSVGSVVGGYAGSRLAQKVSQLAVRRSIVAIGLAATAWLLVARM